MIATMENCPALKDVLILGPAMGTDPDLEVTSRIYSHISSSPYLPTVPILAQHTR